MSNKRAPIADLLSFDVDSKKKGKEPAQPELPELPDAAMNLDDMEMLKKKRLDSIQKEKDLYDQKVGEIERRKKMLESHRSTRMTALEPPKIVLDDLESKYGYKWVLINKAHRFLNIQHDRPAFRILGFFRDDESIMEYVIQLKRMQYLDHLGDIHKLPLMKYTVIAKNKERERDAEYTLRKVEQIKNLHFEHDRKANEEFQDNLTKGKIGDMGKSLYKQKKKKTTTRSKALEHAKKNMTMTEKMEQSVASVPRFAELRNQRYAVIVSLQDFTRGVMKGIDDPEPLVMFIDAFENEDEAKRYIEECLQDYIVNVHLDVVDMYEWLFPEDINPDQITECYRHEELNRIMQERKNQKRELQRFEKKMQHQEKSVPVTEVTDLMPRTDQITRDQDRAFEIEVEERSRENRLRPEDEKSAASSEPTK
jgi:hypothetical protein